MTAAITIRCSHCNGTKSMKERIGLFCQPALMNPRIASGNPTLRPAPQHVGTPRTRSAVGLT